MGQQQLLLLVLGIVIVGLAVVVGIQAFEENQRTYRQDQTAHLMMDLAAKAQLWKITPATFGGGEGTPAEDYSAFTLGAVGLAATEVQGTNEVVRRTDYACLKVFAETDRLEIRALNTDCILGSWWMRLYIVGTGPEDISLEMNDDSAINSNGQ